MSRQSKVCIFKTCARPILTYPRETLKTKSIIRTTEMKVLRTIRGVTLQDRMHTIREELVVQDIVRWVRARRRCWEEHVARMNPNRLAKWARTQKPNTSRPPGGGWDLGDGTKVERRDRTRHNLQHTQEIILLQEEQEDKDQTFHKSFSSSSQISEKAYFLSRSIRFPFTFFFPRSGKL